MLILAPSRTDIRVTTLIPNPDDASGRDIIIRLRDGTEYRGPVVAAGEDETGKHIAFTLRWLAIKRPGASDWHYFWPITTIYVRKSEQAKRLPGGIIGWEREGTTVQLLTHRDTNLLEKDVRGFELIRMTKPEG